MRQGLVPRNCVPPIKHRTLAFIYSYTQHFLQAHIGQLIEQYFDSITGQGLHDPSSNIVCVSFDENPQLTFAEKPQLAFPDQAPALLASRVKSWRGRQVVIKVKVPWTMHDHMGGTAGAEALFARLGLPEKVDNASSQSMRLLRLRHPLAYGILGGWVIQKM